MGLMKALALPEVTTLGSNSSYTTQLQGVNE